MVRMGQATYVIGCGQGAVRPSYFPIRILKALKGLLDSVNKVPLLPEWVK